MTTRRAARAAIIMIVSLSGIAGNVHYESETIIVQASHIELADTPKIIRREGDMIVWLEA